jgi:hypothetical protein
MSYIEDLPEVHFGSVEEKPLDWRAEKDSDEDNDDDLPATAALIDMLGFDPDELEEE